MNNTKKDPNPLSLSNRTAPYSAICIDSFEEIPKNPTIGDVFIIRDPNRLYSIKMYTWDGNSIQDITDDE